MYREKLSAPASWWVIGLAVGVTTAVVIGFWLGAEGAIVAGVIALALVTGAVAWFGSTWIIVDAAGVTVGRSLLEWPYVGQIEALDADATTVRLGVGADATAHTVSRPWLTEAVVIQVVDAADPHPYWLVSSRNPVQCAAAIARARMQATPS